MLIAIQRLDLITQATAPKTNSSRNLITPPGLSQTVTPFPQRVNRPETCPEARILPNPLPAAPGALLLAPWVPSVGYKGVLSGVLRVRPAGNR